MNALLIDLSPFTEAVTPVSLGHIGAALAACGHDVEIISIGASSTVSLAGLRSRLEEFSPGWSASAPTSGTCPRSLRWPG